MMHYFRILSIFLISFAMLVFSSGCDNSVSDEGGHARANGIRISSGGITLVSYFQEEAVTDTLFTEVNDTTAHREIEFFDEDGDLFTPEEDEHELRWEIDNPNLVAIWQHPGEEGGFEFHLRGLAEGVTTLELFVQHLEHNDYRSGLIPVKVRK